MILICPSCDTRYEIPAALPEQGRKVRCAKCGHVWLALPEPEPGPEPPPPPTAIDDDLDFRDRESPAPPAPDVGDVERAPPAPTPVGGEAAHEEPAYREPAREAPAAPPRHVEAEAAAWTTAMGEASLDDDGEPPRPASRIRAAEPARPAPPSAPDTGDVDFEDADEEVPPSARRLAYDGGDIAVADAPRRRRLATSAPLALGWGALALGVLAVLLLGYLMRVDVVRALPATARIYSGLGLPINVRGLQFEDVRYAWAADGGRLVLEVRGEVVNVSPKAVAVPTVKFALRNEQDVEIYQWAADIRGEPLPAGERTRFVTRIPAPPRTVRSLQVRFADRG